MLSFMIGKSVMTNDIFSTVQQELIPWLEKTHMQDAAPSESSLLVDGCWPCLKNDSVIKHPASSFVVSFGLSSLA